VEVDEGEVVDVEGAAELEVAELDELDKIARVDGTDSNIPYNSNDDPGLDEGDD